MIFEALGELVGRAFRLIADAILGTVKWRPERLEEIDKEIGVETLREEMFMTDEFKKLVPELKEKIKHSPMDIPDWLESTVMLPKELLIEPAFKMVTGVDPEKLPENARVVFKGLALLVDYAVLSGILDNVATAASATLLRKVGDMADRIIQATGITLMFGYGLGTALGSALTPPLRYGINEQLTPLVPPLSDIIRFTIREVYVPERRKELLAIPPPEEAYKFGAKHGLPRHHVDDYWAAHWELPPVTHLNEMLYRGLIDLDTWMRYMRYHDYEPGMIEPYKGIIYRPIQGLIFAECGI